jgi:putative N6-adenine-specific DNA methylase
MFTYQKSNIYFAQIAEGLEQIGAEEITALGATQVATVYRGISFTADKSTLYRINYRSRFCQRIMAPLITFDCHSTKYLYQTAVRLPWQELLSIEQTFAIFANVAHSKIRHSRYAALCLKDAIVDSFRERTQQRPNVDTLAPDVVFNLHIDRNHATVSLDTSGSSLHKRGYRQESIEAPMQETLAAAIIGFSGWDGTRPLLDPMCGSGTLLCEALMHICKIPAGYLRKRFGFESLPDFDPSIWQEEKTKGDREITPLGEKIIVGSDASDRSIRAAKNNSQLLPHGSTIQLERRSFQEIGQAEDMTMVCNPPYGIRSGRETDVPALMDQFGSFLKHRCRGSEAYLYFGDRELLKHIGLRPSWKKPLKNGGLDGVLAKYEMY